MKKNWITLFDGTKNEFLSNFYLCSIEYEGIVYPSTEHAFQAAKTHDVVKRELIRDCGTPGNSKRIGRKVDLRTDWEEVKDSVMLEVLRTKFKIPELKERLLATGDATLIEGTTGWHDCYWGVCNCEKCGASGKNMLGTLLMQVREEIADMKGLRDECPSCHRLTPNYMTEDPYNGA